MSLLLLLGLLCLLAGVALGLLGGGGSILAVPVLIYAGGLEPRAAIATSLLVVGASSAVAATAHRARGGVDLRAGLTVGVASMIGAYGGGRIGQFLPVGVLLAVFTAIMASTAVAMMRPRAEHPPVAARRGAVRAIGAGLAVGALTGMVGAGGGFVIVPTLVLFCGLPMRRAIGTSLLVIALNAAAGFAGVAASVSIDLPVAAVATAAATLGSLGGVLASGRVSASTLRTGFGWFVLAMSLFMTAKQLPAGALAWVAAAASHLVAGFGGAAAVAVIWLVLHLRRSHGGAGRPATHGR